MERGVHILELMDLDQAAPGLRQVTAIPMSSVDSVFLVLLEECIENFCLENTLQNIVRFRFCTSAWD